MVAQQNRPYLSAQIYLIFGLFLLAISLSPIFFIFSAVVGIVSLSSKYHYQWIFGILFIFGMSITYASRQFGISPFDDFANIYYPQYKEIASIGVFEWYFQGFSEFSISSLEVGLPLLFSFFAIFDTSISSNTLIFLLTLIGGLFYLYWLIKYVLPNLPRRKSNLALLLSLGLFSFGLCSQLTRQMLSIPFFLMAISDKSLARSTFFLVIGTSFHLITLPLYLFTKCLKFLPKLTTFFSILFGLIIFFYGNAIAAGILGIDVGIFDKLLYYASGNTDAADFSYRYLVLPISWIFLCLVSIKKKKVIPNNFFILMGFFYICFLIFPLLSFRITLVISAALMGLLIFYALMSLNNHKLQVILATSLVTINQLRRWIIYDYESGMSLWYDYAQVGVHPFYYLF